MSLVKYNSILDIFLNNLIPETIFSVKKGNKIFGAFVIEKSDFKLIITGTNNEIVNPLFHGEISAIFNFFKLNKLNNKEKDSLSAKIENITKLYQNLSLSYQNSKISNNIPLK